MKKLGKTCIFVRFGFKPGSLQVEAEAFDIEHLTFSVTFDIRCSMFDIQPGPVAEWLGRALQKLLHQFESGRDLEECRTRNVEY